jgi:hypothetical protein
MERMSDEMNPLGISDIIGMTQADAADCIAALTAELREARMQVLASDGQAAEAYDARIKAEAERDALALRVQRARDDALEEAAHWHDERAADEMAISSKYRSGSNPWFAHIQNAKAHGEYAAAIRALRGATEGAGG